MEELTHKTYAMVVDWDITSPMRAVTDSENLIYKQRTTDCDVALSVVELRRKSYFNMVKKTKHGYVKVIQSDFVACHPAPAVFEMNVSMYISIGLIFFRTSKGIFDGYCETIQMYDAVGIGTERATLC